MKDIKITCDECGLDLTSVESGSNEYRLLLDCQLIHNTSTFRYAMMSYPPLKRSHHFCDFDCLKKWLNR